MVVYSALDKVISGKTNKYLILYVGYDNLLLIRMKTKSGKCTFDSKSQKLITDYLLFSYDKTIQDFISTIFYTR